MQEALFPLFLSFLAGICTVIGGLLILTVKDFKKNYLSFLMGISAGAMVYLSFMELLPYATKSIGFMNSNALFFLGILSIGLIDRIIPHHYISYCSRKSIVYEKLTLTGYMIAFSVMIHNFPEGIAVFMSSLGDLRYGIFIAVATALHNIPEGIAIAAPIYFSTKSKIKAIGYSFIAGIAEPIGALLAYIILSPFITPIFLAYIFAYVAGIMVYISFDELLPTCFEHCQGHTAITGIMMGMMMIAGSLYFL